MPPPLAPVWHRFRLPTQFDYCTHRSAVQLALRENDCHPVPIYKKKRVASKEISHCCCYSSRDEVSFSLERRPCAFNRKSEESFFFFFFFFFCSRVRSLLWRRHTSSSSSSICRWRLTIFNGTFLQAAALLVLRRVVSISTPRTRAIVFAVSLILSAPFVITNWRQHLCLSPTNVWIICVHNSSSSSSKDCPPSSSSFLLKRNFVESIRMVTTTAAAAETCVRTNDICWLKNNCGLLPSFFSSSVSSVEL